MSTRAGTALEVESRRLKLWCGAALLAVVVVVAGLAVRVMWPHNTTARLAADVATRNGPPRYYAYVDPNDEVVVRSSLGRHTITDIIRRPGWVNGGAQGDCAIGASANGHTFVVALLDWNGGTSTRLYSFGLTAAGKVIGYHQIQTRLRGLSGLSVAVSPEGSQVAVAGVRVGVGGMDPANYGAPSLYVVNLHTRVDSSWHARLPGPGREYSIRSAWWTAGTSDLRFLLNRCRIGRDAPMDVGCQTSRLPADQVWSVSVGPLGLGGSGRPILRLPANVAQAVAGPQAGQLTTLWVLRHSVSVRTIALPGGQVVADLYSGPYKTRSMWYAWLAADGTGRHLIVDLDRGTEFGRIHDGRLIGLGGCRLRPSDGVSAPPWKCIYGRSDADYPAW